MPLTCPASKKRNFADMEDYGYLDKTLNFWQAREFKPSKRVGGLQLAGLSDVYGAGSHGLHDAGYVES